jgi:hypothetical protein
MAEYQAFVATDAKRADDWIVRLREHRMLIKNHRLALEFLQSGVIRDADTVSEHAESVALSRPLAVKSTASPREIESRFLPSPDLFPARNVAGLVLFHKSADILRASHQIAPARDRPGLHNYSVRAESQGGEPIHRGENRRPSEVAPDGQRFLVNVPDPTPHPLNVIVNWPALLKK